MPEYLSPAVYVEEVDAGIKPIEGVSTSTAGFVGATRKGPTTGLPLLITSFPEFRRTFGGYLDDTWGDSRFLAYAVQGFFDNGGQRMYVKRVPGTGALKSTANVPDGIVTRLTSDILAGATSANVGSTRGISVNTNLTFSHIVAGVVSTETVGVGSYNADTGALTLKAALTQSYSRNDTAVIVRAPTGVSLQVDALDPGAWGDGVRVRFDYTTPARSEVVSGAVIPLLALTAAPVFAAAGPAKNATTVNLNAGHNLVTGDTVEFVHGAIREQRKITVAVNTINWTGGLANDFSSGSTIREVTAARGGATTSINIPPAMAALLKPNDVVQISGGGNQESLTVTGAWGGASPVDFTAAPAKTYLEGATLTLTSVGVRTGANKVRVASGRNFYDGALVELDNNTDREYFTVTAISGNDLTLSGATAHAYSIGNPVRVCELRMQARYIDNDEHVDQLETFDGLSLNPNLPTKYIQTVVNARSTLVSITDKLLAVAPFSNPATPDGSWLRLSGGDDGGPPGDLDYVGVDLGPGLRTGLQALVDIEEVSIIAIPGKTAQIIQDEMIAQCENLRYRFAVLDPPEGSTIQGVQNFRLNYDTKYAALYYPWVTTIDPLDSTGKTTINLPPSGAVVGIYARTDTERGVFKAPANEVIRNITGLEQYLNKAEHDILNPEPVNIDVLRDFRPHGRGLRVWGARCITSDTSWKYVNVRRLFIFLEKSLDVGLQWVVFEPNDYRLWARVKQSISVFLTRVWRDGALMGTKPEEAFFVKCDRSTMTQDDLDNGRLIVLVGIAPVKPAEFVIIRIGQWQGGSAVQEL